MAETMARKGSPRGKQRRLLMLEKSLLDGKRTVWSVAGLVAHQRVVTVICLDDRGCLEIKFVAEMLEGLLTRMRDLQTMHHLLEAGESLVEPRNVNIPPFLAVSV